MRKCFVLQIKKWPISIIVAKWQNCPGALFWGVPLERERGGFINEYTYSFAMVMHNSLTWCLHCKAPKIHIILLLFSKKKERKEKESNVGSDTTPNIN